MAQYECRTLDFLYDIRHGECFARSGDTEERLRRASGLDAFGKLPDGLWLVACGLIL